MPKAVEALIRQLDSLVTQLRQVEEALERKVQRAAGGEEDSTTVVEQVKLAVQLEDNLRLLTAKKCSVVAEDDGATWTAWAELGGFGDILRLLLLQLRANGELEKVEDAACTPSPGVYVGPPIISVLRTKEDDCEDGHLKVNDLLLDRQRWRYARSLKSSHADGLEGLLSVVAPQLEELEIPRPVQPSVMVEVEKMKSLKRLEVRCVDDLDYADLPLQLEELAIRSPCENQLRCVGRMPRLRSLQVDDYLGPNVSFAPSQHGTLRWLSLCLNTKHKSTMMSLIRAYASSVQEIVIFCSVGDDYLNKGFYFPDLGEDLAACGLLALRRLVLDRPAADPCTDQVAACLLQCRTIGSSLPSYVQVVCETCHMSPF
ncbi:uncharacterized protein LOC113212502 [Frankliniella occidentalis]|uniref:Uncharacterized protein LOC113212502 n=1 Tax=Frankliniella occidentalis TaxID=133901 RepID=A0A6J1T0G3_FRAOC|nr:uncharacterized protein LOC113212502 [Frankliniella occidentalis]